MIAEGEVLFFQRHFQRPEHFNLLSNAALTIWIILENFERCCSCALLFCSVLLLVALSAPCKQSISSCSPSPFFPSADSYWMKFLSCKLPACADHSEMGFFIVLLPQLSFCSSISYAAKGIALFLHRVWQSIFKKKPLSTSRQGSHSFFTQKHSERLRCCFKTNDQWYHRLCGCQSEEKLFFSETSLIQDLLLNWKVPV